MRKRVMLFVAGLLLAGGSAEAASLLGISWDGTVSLIDESNGQGSALGDSGFGGVNALARNASGQFVGVARELDDDASTLFSVNPSTGAGVEVFDLDFGNAEGSVRGLTFGSNGTLYAINNGGGRFSTSDPDDLFSIDLQTGKAALIGNTGYLGIQALATAPDGRIYGWDVGTSALDGKGLILIDPATGAASDIDSSIGEEDDVDIQTLAFSSDGKLYGGRNALYAIDPSSGSAALVGSGGYSDVRGFEFLRSEKPGPVDGNGSHGSVVPEPGSAILLALGLLAAPRRRRSIA